TCRPPKLYAILFHPELRFYTLLMVDLVVPDQENQSFRTYLHWLPNFSLSESTTFIGSLPPVAHTPYVPLHPTRETPYQRPVPLLLPHA
ncbi:hypothetical protein H4582DRAFT_1799293, partial [Lactarius indigo]